jgi:hypothetical protein
MIHRPSHPVPGISDPALALQLRLEAGAFALGRSALVLRRMDLILGRSALRNVDAP